METGHSRTMTCMIDGGSFLAKTGLRQQCLTMSMACRSCQLLVSGLSMPYALLPSQVATKAYLVLAAIWDVSTSLHLESPLASDISIFLDSGYRLKHLEQASNAGRRFVATYSLSSAAELHEHHES